MRPVGRPSGPRSTLGGASALSTAASARLFSIQSDPVWCCTRSRWRGAISSKVSRLRSPAMRS
jgi:hypothetical protein